MVMENLFVLLTALTIASVRSQSPVFLVNPTSIAAVDGSTVEFTCEAHTNSDTLTYRVNGTSASFGSVANKGFKQFYIEEIANTPIIRRNLSVTVSSLYNNTEVLCRVFSPTENSDIATLTVQGRLSAVGDLLYTSTDSSINISWSPPFTLPGTDITGYNISVTTSDGTTTDYYTSNSYYVLLLTDITDSPCDQINITVSGYNGLNGEDESISGHVFQSLTSITEDFNEDKELSLLVNVADVCVDDIVTNFNVTVWKGGIFYKSAIALAGNTINLTDVFELMEDQNYTVNITFDVVDEKNVKQSSINFDTYGVRSINVTDTDEDTVYIVCLFNTFSTDSGCTVVLVSTTDQQQQYEGTFNKIDDGTASGNITSVVTGVYNILAFDVGSNIVAFKLSNVTITGEPSSAISNTPAILISPSTISASVTFNPNSFNQPAVGRGTINSLTAICIVIPLAVLLLLQQF